MQRLDQLLEDVSAGEVPFQLHYSAQDLRSLLSSCMSGPDRKLAVMRDRVGKHLGGGGPALLRDVWARCAARNWIPHSVSFCFFLADVTRG